MFKGPDEVGIYTYKIKAEVYSCYYGQIEKTNDFEIEVIKVEADENPDNDVDNNA